MKLKTVAFIATTILFLLMGSHAFGIVIEKGPYLMYEGDNTAMTVLWQTDVSGTCTIEWGTSTSYTGGSVQSTEYGSDHQHKFTLTGLNNGTKYYYRVQIGTNWYTGNFRSAPAASAQNLKFFAYGDTRSNPGDHNAVAGQMINTFTNDPEFQTLTIHSGDWANSNSESSWTSEFFPRSQANIMGMQSKLPIQGIRGNHESNGSILGKYYPFPYVSNFYWSYDYGPIHVVNVDIYVSYSSGSAQYNWLVNDLSNSTKKWKVVVFHGPAWSAGGGHSNNTTAQNNIQPLLVQYGVQLVFNGDNHYYSRCVVEDVQHITTGGGGAPLYTPNTGSQYLVASNQSNHHCEIDIQGNTLNFTARNKNGTAIDSFTLNYTGGSPTVTADFSSSANLLDVNFSDASSADNTTITSWNWDFGDGNSSTQQNPAHSYAAAGTYNVKLTVSDGTISDDITKQVTVQAGGTPSINADFTSTTNNLTVNFSDGSTATNTTITTWSWNFGDSTNSTQQHPVHTYAAAGTYSVSLTVGDGTISDNVTKSVTVTSGGPTYCASSGSSQKYEWIAGVQVGNVTNNTAAGAYTDYTAQTVNTSEGSTVSVTLTPGFAGTAYTEYWKIWVDYNHDGDFTDSGEEVFSKSGKAAVTGSFVVPSSTAGSTRMRVSMLYNAAPSSCGSLNYGEVEDYSITISGSTVNPPTAAFTANVTAIATGGSVTFSDQSTNNPSSWSWSFNNGTPNSSTAQNPTVTYNTAGTYTVVLTVSNSAGSDDETKLNYITVTDTPVDYCDSSGSSQQYEWIAGVQVGNVTNNSGASAYTYYTAQVVTASPGATVSVNVTPGFAGQVYTEYWKIWVDWNNDGDFTDTGEEVYSGSGQAALSGNFTVPAGAAGSTRMRVSMRYNAAPSSCGSLSYGEVEDYTFTVQ